MTEPAISIGALELHLDPGRASPFCQGLTGLIIDHKRWTMATDGIHAVMVRGVPYQQWMGRGKNRGFCCQIERTLRRKRRLTTVKTLIAASRECKADTRDSGYEYLGKRIGFGEASFNPILVIKALRHVPRGECIVHSRGKLDPVVIRDADWRWMVAIMPMAGDDPRTAFTGWTEK